MKKFKKAIALLLVMALTAGIAIAGTIAYLTDTDSAVNTMTVGNVKIVQHEKKRAYEDGAYTGRLTDFVDDVPLYPITLDPYAGYSNFYDQGWNEVESGAEYGMFSNSNNAVDKIVTVENTGVSSAFVRTVFAFEMKMVEGAAIDPVGSDVMYVVNDFDINWLKDNEESDEVDANNEYITIKLRNGNWYIVGVYYYDVDSDGKQESLLNPGQTTEASLLQLYLKSTAGNEWYDQVGEKYEVLVLSQAIQSAGFNGAQTALDQGFGEVNEPNALIWFNGLVDEAVDTWDGTSDTTWYNDTDTEFMITTAEQLAGFSELVDGGNTFAGKTVKVGKNIDLYYVPEGETEPVCFNPIGSYRNEKAFMGTFDGQGYTISNMRQNTWALDTGYYYGDLGLGLFSLVEDATIKKLNMDAANISGESAICGTVAACAYGDTTFENINVTNTQVADYQYYAGGVVGWASGNHKYLNCDVAASTTIGAQWGDFDNSTGGVIGGAGGNATIYMKDCDVACRIDGYNDVTSSYQWYAYRRCGMLIGNTGKTTTNEGGTTVAAAPQLTCENVTVTYGEWANYTYCEFAGKNWSYVRVQAGISNSAYSNPRYGHPTDANGNEVVDDNHIHNEGEDHHILCAFDQLYGGGQGVYGTAAHEGVTVIYNNK